MTHPHTTPSEPTASISLSALRQLLTAAGDAGLAGVLSASVVRHENDRIVITISARESRALTNWLTAIGEAHRDAPIVATTVPTLTHSDTKVQDAWAVAVFDATRPTPAGYSPAVIPPTFKKKGNK